MNPRTQNRSAAHIAAEDPGAQRTEEDAAAPKAASGGGAASDPALPGDAHADPGRIAAMIDAIAAINEGTEGVTRLAYTKLERQAHELVAGWLRDLRMTVGTDAVGNTIAERPGARPEMGAIGVGSHVDSVPSGGRFDGVAGVAAATEMIRLLTEHDIAHAHPLRVIIFAGEEGARFGQACLGSKAVAGLLDERELTSRLDADGVSLAEAMSSVGLDPARAGEARWSRDEWAAFLELHIEQGRVLEAEDVPIGVVDLVSGSTRLLIDATGRSSHSGGTPMGLRADALTAVAEIVLLAERVATDPRHRGTRATVGRLTVDPGNITTIPGRVSFSVDVRDVDSDRQRETAAEIVRRARAICDRRGVGLAVQVIGDSSPVVLSVWLRQLVGEACADQGIPYRVLSSGASHDTQMVNHVTPAGMIFVPSKAGLSHVPEEWTSAADIARGTDVLTRGVLTADGMLSQLATKTDG